MGSLYWHGSLSLMRSHKYLNTKGHPVTSTVSLEFLFFAICNLQNKYCNALVRFMDSLFSFHLPLCFVAFFFC